MTDFGGSLVRNAYKEDGKGRRWQHLEKKGAIVWSGYPAFQGPNRHVLIVVAISVPTTDLVRVLHRHCFSEKHSGKTDQLTMATGGSEHA